MHLDATLLGQMITFAIFVWFTMRVIWPILMGLLEDRKKRIADGLAAAEQGRKLLISSEANAKSKIQETKAQCNKLLEEASREAAQILEDSRAQARKERDGILAAGDAQLRLAIKQAKTDLQDQIAGIVVLGAEKILERSINVEDHQDIMNDLAKKLA